MKILLDENLPKRLKKDFPEHDVFTVREMGWQGKKNGALMQLMMNEGFQVLLTFDKNMLHQQNFSKYPLAVFIINAKQNTHPVISQFVNKIKTQLTGSIKAGATIIK